MNVESKVPLNDGNLMPWFGLGVYQASNAGECENAVYDALNAGYRHIDTAEIYRNEDDVGKAISRFLSENTTVSREDIWVTTKFFPQAGRGKAAVKQALATSLTRLGLSYVDLYLIHSPNVKDLRIEQWQAFEELKDEGLVKSIGVSNYGIHHLQELLAVAKYKPTVNQVELNPYITRTELTQFCKSEGIVVEAYSPLTKSIKLNDPKLVAIAAKYDVTTAQILIRWCLQKGVVVIPKSVTKTRIIENANVFDMDISEEDMATLDTFDEYLVTGWDPTRSA